MATDPTTMEQIAGGIRAALQSADLDGYREFLDLDVTWGAPDDPTSGCRNRDQVLSWYRRGRADGTRADVTEAGVYGDTIHVGLNVVRDRSPAGTGEPTERWQALTIEDGLVTDIRGFEEGAEAMSRLS